MKASEWLITPEKRQRPRATRPAASAADDTCEAARKMRTGRKRNENVPMHFFCFGTFFVK